MIIRATILKTNDPQAEPIIIEKTGDGMKSTLLKFWWECRKYANKDHKIAKIETSDMTTLAYLNEKIPTVRAELIDDPSEEIGPEDSQKIVS